MILFMKHSLLISIEKGDDNNVQQTLAFHFVIMVSLPSEQALPIDLT